MVSLYYISTYLLKINRVFSTKAFLNFIKNLILLNLLSSKTKNSFNIKISILSVYIFTRLNTSFLVVIKK